MKSLWLKFTPLLVCLLLSSGCGSAIKLSNVLITIQEYSPTTTENQVRLKVHFSNENTFPIAIAGITGKLYLEGNYVGKFVLTEPIGIPRLGTMTREVMLLIEKPEVLQTLRAVSAGSISYKLACKLSLEISEDRSNSHTASKGQIATASLRAEPIK